MIWVNFTYCCTEICIFVFFGYNTEWIVLAYMQWNKKTKWLWKLKFKTKWVISRTILSLFPSFKHMYSIFWDKYIKKNQKMKIIIIFLYISLISFLLVWDWDGDCEWWGDVWGRQIDALPLIIFFICLRFFFWIKNLKYLLFHTTQVGEQFSHGHLNSATCTRPNETSYSNRKWNAFPIFCSEPKDPPLNFNYTIFISLFH